MRRRGVYRKGGYRKKTRYGGRKYVKRKMKATVRSNPTFMPDRYFTKLQYSDFTTVTDALGTGGRWTSRIYRGNGIFDPDQAIGGMQPLAFDQLTAMYRRYRVYASKIHVRVHSLNSSGVAPYYLAVCPYAGTNFSSTGWVNDIVEQPYVRYFTRNQYDANPAIKHCMSTAKIYGLNKNTVKTDDTFSAAAGSLPASQWSWIVAVGNLNVGASADTSYILEIKMTYYVEFYDRINLQRS